MSLSITLRAAALAAVLGSTHLLQAAPFDWPQWRGQDRSDVSDESGLLKAWPAEGPKRVWLFENAGNGYSGPAIANGKFFTAGTRDGSEILLVLDAETGKELWTSKIGPVLENNWGGGPRSTPTVYGDLVYVLSGTGNLVCAGVADGKLLWQVSMAELGGKVPGWGYTESVLIDGDKVLCTPGGEKGAVAALDRKTGKVLWQSTDFKDGAQYESIMPAEIKGVRQYIQLTSQNLVSLSATDGKILWKTSFQQGRVAVIPTPVVKGNQVYITAGYGAGCKSVTFNGDNEVTTLYENKVMKNHHGGVVLVGDYIYGHSDGYAWVCQNFKTGEEVWSHREFGKGAVTCADGKLYRLEEGSGTVVLADASPAGWKESGRFKLDPQTKIRNPQGKIWTHPVISNGKLYLRDQDLIYCYDVKTKGSS